MKKIGENVASLELTMRSPAGASTIHPIVLWGGSDGATLIDAGIPGLYDAIVAALDEVGLAPKDIKRLILTHQDLDHIGSAAAVVSASGARVFAHALDAPYIRGEKPLIKMSPERLKQMLDASPESEHERIRKIFGIQPKVHIDEILQGGEELPFHGGMTVINTHGHTPGHISLFLKEHGLLIAGDALRTDNGTIIGPNPPVTPDMDEAVRSIRALSAFPISRVVCYHGGLSTGEVGPRLRELAAGA